ncbi:hypothetical protein PP304_gp147 [Gordonia phage Phendrix]|uniref:Uncharacterized protein n=2 Tax=Godonkavirus TaxID=2733178 RepID=A0A4D6E2H0_9CAUD|nr:hypothetical protein HOV33_gp150 [Gordonia phage GodonK]YP_010649220.1 hypothetical protein PP304_gp147 [Gordonia phage Phendrix]QBZ72806.1 hypothetical protein SEA_GODONK_218 [Gordonia phage GodonK]QDK02722.1 hypothetical protein SEA_PHENDRIX_206 [Gordonia phage Phendrix]
MTMFTEPVRHPTERPVTVQRRIAKRLNVPVTKVEIGRDPIATEWEVYIDD